MSVPATTSSIQLAHFYTLPDSNFVVSEEIKPHSDSAMALTYHCGSLSEAIFATTGLPVSAGSSFTRLQIGCTWTETKGPICPALTYDSDLRIDFTIYFTYLEN